jgi:hypothetical protein
VWELDLKQQTLEKEKKKKIKLALEQQRDWDWIKKKAHLKTNIEMVQLDLKTNNKTKLIKIECGPKSYQITGLGKNWKRALKEVKTMRKFSVEGVKTIEKKDIPRVELKLI